MKTLEVLFTPAEFAMLLQRDLRETICVVFDVLRATSSIVSALGNGAAAIVPVESIPEALAVKQREPHVLLAGERDGIRIPARLTGGTDFDLGNSPREFTKPVVGGRAIVMTTTNGTRALRACAQARLLLACSFLNLSATARFLMRQSPAELLLVCSGTHEEAAYEDVLGAGALCDLLGSEHSDRVIADSALMARQLFRLERHDLASALGRSRNGRRLLAITELRQDVEACSRQDSVDVVVTMDREGGRMTRHAG